MNTEQKISLDRMSQDTRRIVEEIVKNGYCREGITLEEAGWSYLYTFPKIQGWGKYILYIRGETVETIRAKNNKAAKDAFFNLYRLNNTYFEICLRSEKIVYKTICSSTDEVTE